MNARVPFTHTSTTKSIISKSLMEITDDVVRKLKLNDKDPSYDIKYRHTLIIR